MPPFLTLWDWFSFFLDVFQSFMSDFLHGVVDVLLSQNLEIAPFNTLEKSTEKKGQNIIVNPLTSNIIWILSMLFSAFLMCWERNWISLTIRSFSTWRKCPLISCFQLFFRGDIVRRNSILVTPTGHRVNTLFRYVRRDLTNHLFQSYSWSIQITVQYRRI